MVYFLYAFQLEALLVIQSTCSCVSTIRYTGCIVFLLLVSVKWQLHFEFLISRTAPIELMRATPTASLSGSSATLWKKEDPVTVDTMMWDLPVNILPTWPEQAEPMTQAHQHELMV